MKPPKGIHIISEEDIQRALKIVERLKTETDLSQRSDKGGSVIGNAIVVYYDRTEDGEMRQAEIIRNWDIGFQNECPDIFEPWIEELTKEVGPYFYYDSGLAD